MEIRVRGKFFCLWEGTWEFLRMEGLWKALRGHFICSLVPTHLILQQMDEALKRRDMLPGRDSLKFPLGSSFRSQLLLGLSSF